MLFHSVSWMLDQSADGSVLLVAENPQGLAIGFAYPLSEARELARQLTALCEPPARGH